MTDLYIPPVGQRVRIVEVHPGSWALARVKPGEEYVSIRAIASRAFPGYIEMSCDSHWGYFRCRVEPVEAQTEPRCYCGSPSNAHDVACPVSEPERQREFCQCGQEVFRAGWRYWGPICGDCRAALEKNQGEPLDSRIAAAQPEPEELGAAWATPSAESDI